MLRKNNKDDPDKKFKIKKSTSSAGMGGGYVDIMESHKMSKRVFEEI